MARDDDFHQRFPDSAKEQANRNAAQTSVTWVHRFERILALPPGHIWPSATDKMPAYVFADYVARVKARLGLAVYQSTLPRKRWEDLTASAELIALRAIEPDDFLPRSLAAKLVVHELQLSAIQPVAVPFDDVSIDDPAWHDVMILRHLGIVGGWHDPRYFLPQRGITYAECAKVLAGTFTVKKLGLVSSTKAFFAHSSVDKDFVRDLKARLSRRRVHGWIDEERLPPGTPLRSALAEVIADPSVVVIAVISSHSVKSRWVQEELELALEYARPKRPKLVPLVIDDCEIPPMLRRLVYVSLQAAPHDGLAREADVERAVETLLTAIEDIELDAALARDAGS